MNQYHFQEHQHHSSSYGHQGSGGWTMEKDDMGGEEVSNHSSKDDVNRAFPYIVSGQNSVVCSMIVLGTCIYTEPRILKLQCVPGHFQKDCTEVVYQHKSGRLQDCYNRKIWCHCRTTVCKKCTNERAVEHIQRKTARPVNAGPSAKFCLIAMESSSGSEAREARAVDFAKKNIMTMNGANVGEVLSLKQGPILI